MKDIKGKKFGLLTVLEYAEPAKSRGKHRWKCLCDCGTYSIVQDNHLKTGNTKSCGCLHARKGKDSPLFKGHGEISLDFYNHIKRACETPQKYRLKREFSVTIEYLWNLYVFQNRKCAISNADITFTEREGNRGRRCSASLDRIDSSKGYIEGNVQWVHKTINIMKNKLSMQDFVKWCKAVSTNNP